MNDITSPGRPLLARPTTLALVLGALLAVGGVSFLAGRLSTGSVAPQAGSAVGPEASAGAAREGGPPAGIPGGGRIPGGAGSPAGAGGGPPGVSGTVVGVSETELTVRTTDGQTVVVPLDETTAYRRESGASVTDVEVGASVDLTVGTSVALQVTVVEP